MDEVSDKLMSDEFQDALNLIIIRLAKSALVHHPLDINKHFDEILAADLDRRTLVDMQFEPYYQRTEKLIESEHLYTVQPDKEIMDHVLLENSTTGSHLNSAFKDKATSTWKNPERMSNNTKNAEFGIRKLKPPPIPPRYNVSKEIEAVYPQEDKASIDIPTVELPTGAGRSASNHMLPDDDGLNECWPALEGMMQGYVLAFDTSDADDNNDNAFGLPSRREMYERDLHQCIPCDYGHFMSQSSSSGDSSEDNGLNSSDPINEEDMIAPGWFDAPNYFNVPGNKANMPLDLSPKNDSNPLPIKPKESNESERQLCAEVTSDEVSSMHEKNVSCSEDTQEEEEEDIFMPDGYNREVVYPPVTLIDQENAGHLKIQSEKENSLYTLQTGQQSFCDATDIQTTQRLYNDTTSLVAQIDNEKWPDLPTDLESIQMNQNLYFDEEMLPPDYSSDASSLPSEPESIRPVRVVRLTSIEEDNLESAEDNQYEPPAVTRESSSKSSCSEVIEPCENEQLSNDADKKSFDKLVGQSVLYAALCYMNREGTSTTEDLMQDMLQSDVGLLGDEEDDSDCSGTYLDTHDTFQENVEKDEEDNLSENLESNDQLPVNSDVPTFSSACLAAEKMIPETFSETILFPLASFVDQAAMNEQVASNLKVKEIEAWLHRGTSGQDGLEKIKDDESWLSLWSSKTSSQADNESEMLDKRHDRIEFFSKHSGVENDIQSINDATRDKQPEISGQLSAENRKNCKPNLSEDLEVRESYSGHGSLASVGNRKQYTIIDEMNLIKYSPGGFVGLPAAESLNTDTQSEFSSASNIEVLADNFKTVYDHTRKVTLMVESQENSSESFKKTSMSKTDSSFAGKLLEGGRLGKNTESTVKGEKLPCLPITDNYSETNVGEVLERCSGLSVAPDDSFNSYRYDKMNFLTSVSAQSSRNDSSSGRDGSSSIQSSFLKTNNVKTNSVDSCIASLSTGRYIKSKAVDSSNAESADSRIADHCSSISLMSDPHFTNLTVTPPTYIDVPVASKFMEKSICLITQCKPLEQNLEKSSSVHDCRFVLSAAGLESISMPASFGVVPLSDHSLAGTTDVTVSNASFFSENKFLDTIAVRQSSHHENSLVEKTSSKSLIGSQLESDIQNILIQSDSETLDLNADNTTHSHMTNSLSLQDWTDKGIFSDVLEIDPSAIWRDAGVNISDQKIMSDEQYSASVIQTMDPVLCDVAAVSQVYSGPTDTFPCADETCLWTVHGKIRQPDINFSFMSSPCTAGDQSSPSDVDKLNSVLDDFHCAESLKQTDVSSYFADSVEYAHKDQQPKPDLVCNNAVFDACPPQKELSYATIVLEDGIQMQYTTETTSPLNGPVSISISENSNNMHFVSVSRISNLKKSSHIHAFDSVSIHAVDIRNDAVTFTSDHAHNAEISNTCDDVNLLPLELKSCRTDAFCDDVDECQIADDPESIVSCTTLSVQSMDDREEQSPVEIDSFTNILSDNLWALTDESYDITENDLWKSKYNNNSDSPQFNESSSDNESYYTAYDGYWTEDESFDWTEDSYTAAVISSMEDHNPAVIGISREFVVDDKPCGAPEVIGDEPSSVGYPDEPIQGDGLVGTFEPVQFVNNWKEKEAMDLTEGHDERLEEAPYQGFHNTQASHAEHAATQKVNDVLCQNLPSIPADDIGCADSTASQHVHYQIEHLIQADDIDYTDSTATQDVDHQNEHLIQADDKDYAKSTAAQDIHHQNEHPIQADDVDNAESTATQVVDQQNEHPIQADDMDYAEYLATQKISNESEEEIQDGESNAAVAQFDDHQVTSEQITSLLELFKSEETSEQLDAKNDSESSEVISEGHMRCTIVPENVTPSVAPADSPIDWDEDTF